MSCAAAVGGEKTVASASVPKVTGGGRGKGEEANKPSGLKKAAAGGSASAMAFGDNLGTGNVNGQTGQRLASSPQACRDEAATMGIDSVATELTRRAKIPSRVTSSNLYFAFDHCFSVRGQGTILTGTVLRGEVKVSEGEYGFVVSVSRCCHQSVFWYTVYFLSPSFEAAILHSQHIIKKQICRCGVHTYINTLDVNRFGSSSWAAASFHVITQQAD